MLPPGTILDHRYELLDVLGTGGFATVYRARHLGLLSVHAVKVLEAHLAAEDEVRGRFLAEGRIQAQLRHPNVVAVTDIVTHPVAGLVMDLVEGPTLEALTAPGGTPLSPAEVADLLLPVLDAVAAAHAGGVVHRDLKPANILVARDAAGRPRPMVTDFGIARVVDGSSVSAAKARTRTGIRMGTLHYMSPEQVRGAKDVDARTDVFALGAILYELLTGRIAFAADSEFDTMRNIVDGRYDPPDRRVSGPLAEVIRCALDVDPARRPADGAALRVLLAAALAAGTPEGRALPGGPAPAGKAAPTPVAKAAPTPVAKAAPTPVAKAEAPKPAPVAKAAPTPVVKAAPTPVVKAAPAPPPVKNAALAPLDDACWFCSRDFVGSQRPILLPVHSGRTEDQVRIPRCRACLGKHTTPTQLAMVGGVLGGFLGFVAPTVLGFEGGAVHVMSWVFGPYLGWKAGKVLGLVGARGIRPAEAYVDYPVLRARLGAGWQQGRARR